MTCDYKTKDSIYCKRLVEEAKLPTKNNEQDAGWDLYALEDIVVPSLFKHVFKYTVLKITNIIGWFVGISEPNLFATKVKTGIACELPQNTVGLIWDRSGIGSKLIKVFGGVIDCTYRGEIIVCLANFSFTDYNIKAGDRIAQMVVQRICNTKMVEVAELSETFRGKSGFGSSGA